METPAFKYFLGKINNEPNLSELYQSAQDYIKRNYPEAKPGNNYYFSLNQETIPLPEQYFLRKMTYRSCIPPYKDVGLSALEDEVIRFVQQANQVTALQSTPG